MAENINDRLKTEIESYNKFNKEKSELESRLGEVNKDMFKIIGKLELLNDLNEKKDKK